MTQLGTRSASRFGSTFGLALRLTAGLGLPLTLTLAGCGGDTPPATLFKPFSYSYLTPLRLNVGQIRVEDHVPPPQGPNELGPTAPVPPDQALQQMAQDRLVAAGNSGIAVFSIDQASITGQAGGTLDGTLAVHLDIVGSSGGHEGYAEAHVSREFVPGSATDNDGLKSQLYGLTRQMMQDMNVEFEFQFRRTLGDWMLDASGAPVAATVDQQPLTGPATPGATPPPASAPASVGAPMELAPPPSAGPSVTVPGTTAAAPAATDAGGGGSEATGPASSGPLQLSPQPGVLQAPTGAMPTASPPVAPPAVAAPAALPSAQPYHGQYPTPPGYHPSGTPTGDAAATAPNGY